MGSLLIQTARQGGKTLAAQYFAHGRWAERDFALLEGLADFINGVVLFAQLDDEVPGGGFFGLSLRAMARGDKKDGFGFPAEVMAEDIEGVERIAESASDLIGGTPFDHKGAQSLVLTVLGQPRLEEEAAELT